MPGIGELADAFNTHAASTCAALLTAALAYLFVAYRKANADHLETVKAIIPIAVKLGEGVEALERVLRENGGRDANTPH